MRQLVPRLDGATREIQGEPIERLRHQRPQRSRSCEQVRQGPGFFPAEHAALFGDPSMVLG